MRAPFVPLPAVSPTTAPAAPALLAPASLRPLPARLLSRAPIAARCFQSAAERSGLADLYASNRSDARRRPRSARPPVLPESAWRRTLIAGPASPNALTRATDPSLLPASSDVHRPLECCLECLARTRAFRAREARRQADALAGRPIQRPRPRPVRPPLRPYPPVLPLPPAVLYDQPAVPVHTVEAQHLFRRRVAQAGQLLLGLSLAGGAAYAFLTLSALHPEPIAHQPAQPQH